MFHYFIKKYLFQIFFIVGKSFPGKQFYTKQFNKKKLVENFLSENISHLIYYSKVIFIIKIFHNFLIKKTSQTFFINIIFEYYIQ